jgi:serine/threonine protein kinase
MFTECSRNVSQVDFDQIEIYERIGTGSFGEVYHANLYGTEVAVKFFYKQEANRSHKELFKEFQKEVELMACLRHPVTYTAVYSCPVDCQKASMYGCVRFYISISHSLLGDRPQPTGPNGLILIIIIII